MQLLVQLHIKNTNLQLTPTHNWAEVMELVLLKVTLIRAEWYSQKDEKNWRESVDREVIVRNSVGFSDVSTLGKIDIHEGCKIL